MHFIEFAVTVITSSHLPLSYISLSGTDNMLYIMQKRATQFGRDAYYKVNENGISVMYTVFVKVSPV